MSLLIYISHPEVIQDPTVPVPRWALTETGIARTTSALTASWSANIGRVISSDETKALMAAEILATHRGIEVEVREATGETDRSATGYVPHERHEALANQFFANPSVSADGWETAGAAQRRVTEALADVLAKPLPTESDTGERADPDIAVVGHGGVGTLLRCHLAGLAIDRRHDQPGPGHYWTLDRPTGSVLHGWLPIDG